MAQHPHDANWVASDEIGVTYTPSSQRCRSLTSTRCTDSMSAAGAAIQHAHEEIAEAGHQHSGKRRAEVS
jgi:hypothetical protein